MASIVTPIRPPPPEAAFIRGIRTCVSMLEDTCDHDQYHVKGVGRHRNRRPQNNVVWSTLERLIESGERRELQGFCAVLTEISAIADRSGDYSRIFAEYADRRERVMRRWYQRRTRGLP